MRWAWVGGVALLCGLSACGATTGAAARGADADTGAAGAVAAARETAPPDRGGDGLGGGIPGDGAEVAADGRLPDWPSDKYVSPAFVHARVVAADPDLQLLNVSDAEFWPLGHLAGSLVIPWTLLAGRLAEVDRASHTLVYCRRGVRSEAAYETLANAGFANVFVMSGGLEAWIAAGYPVVFCGDPTVRCE